MAAADQDHATQIVGELSAGDHRRAPELVYGNLKRYAAAVMGGRGDRTLQPTALVNG